jgi:hypothetical protein
LYYIPNEETIAKENEILAKDEVDWPELTEYRKEIDKEIQDEMDARKPDLVQVWFTGEEEVQYLATQTDLLYRRSYQRRWRYRQCKDGL